MISLRSLAFAVLITAAVAAAPLRAPADPPPWAHGGQHDEQGRAQDRGVISGEVVGIDYSSGALLLQSGGRRFSVTVLPSTNIFQGKRGYATLADLSRGRRVDVWVSETGGRLFAQIIRIN